MPTLAIVNPFAGKRAGLRVARAAREAVVEVRDWEWVSTERPGHARELARSAPANGFDRVVAVGGDGTVYEVVNGLADSGIPLGIVPAGTGNDLAISLGVPLDTVAAARLAATGRPRNIDLGEIQTPQSTSLFVNVAGFGFDAEVAWRVNRLPKLIGGSLPYVAGVLQTLWQYAAPSIRISVDGRTLDQAVFLVAVANCPRYGGGLRIAPAAQPDDGVLDVCLVKDLSRLEVLRMLPRLYSGGHVGHRAVELFRCRELTADAAARVLCQADGELVGELPARFGIRPGALGCVTGPAFQKWS